MARISDDIDQRLRVCVAAGIGASPELTRLVLMDREGRQWDLCEGRNAHIRQAAALLEGPPTRRAETLAAEALKIPSLGQPFPEKECVPGTVRGEMVMARAHGDVRLSYRQIYSVITKE